MAFDHWQLALIKLEIDNLPGLSFFASEVPLNLGLKSFLWHLLGFVQPGCTVKPQPNSPLCSFPSFSAVALESEVGSLASFSSSAPLDATRVEMALVLPWQTDQPYGCHAKCPVKYLGC